MQDVVIFSYAGDMLYYFIINFSIDGQVQYSKANIQKHTLLLNIYRSFYASSSPAIRLRLLRVMIASLSILPAVISEYAW